MEHGTWNMDHDPAMACHGTCQVMPCHVMSCHVMNDMVYGALSWNVDVLDVNDASSSYRLHRNNLLHGLYVIKFYIRKDILTCDLVCESGDAWDMLRWT